MGNIDNAEKNKYSPDVLPASPRQYRVRAPPKRECISSSLAVVLASCLAGALVVLLLQNESAHYAHAVHSSLIAVLAVHISKYCQACWPVLELRSSLVMLDNMIFNSDFRKKFGRF